jgi:hypothetical protein
MLRQASLAAHMHSHREVLTLEVLLLRCDESGYRGRPLVPISPPPSSPTPSTTSRFNQAPPPPAPVTLRARKETKISDETLTPETPKPTKAEIARANGAKPKGRVTSRGKAISSQPSKVDIAARTNDPDVAARLQNLCASTGWMFFPLGTSPRTFGLLTTVWAV